MAYNLINLVWFSAPKKQRSLTPNFVSSSGSSIAEWARGGRPNEFPKFVLVLASQPSQLATAALTSLIASFMVGSAPYTPHQRNCGLSENCNDSPIMPLDMVSTVQWPPKDPLSTLVQSLMNLLCQHRLLGEGHSSVLIRN